MDPISFQSISWASVAFVAALSGLAYIEMRLRQSGAGAQKASSDEIAAETTARREQHRDMLEMIRQHEHRTDKTIEVLTARLGRFDEKIDHIAEATGRIAVVESMLKTLIEKQGHPSR